MRLNSTMLAKMNMLFSPSKIILGNDALSKAGEEAKKLGGHKALIVTDKGVCGAGLLKGLEESLRAQEIVFEIYDKVLPEPPARLVDESASIVRDGKFDIIIGVGGGSSLDVAKGASVIALQPGKAVDYAGIDKIPGRGIPKILIPTTAGTGSEASRVFVVTDEADHTKKVVYSDFVLADVAIVDPLLTVSCPPAVTADTGMDALVHAIEAYVSRNATPFSDILALEAIGLIGEDLPLAYSKAENLEARFNMSFAATLAGMAFTSGGLGAVHALAYVLGTEWHLSHGRTNAIMLPYVVGYNIPGSPRRYAEIARAMGEVTDGLSEREAATKLIPHLFRLLETIGIPAKLADYDITGADLEKLVEGGMAQNRLFVPNPRNLTEADVRAIYASALK